MTVHIVTMYRWGQRDKHSYVLGAFRDKAQAVSAACKEEQERGGTKYIAEVLAAPLGKGIAWKQRRPIKRLPVFMIRLHMHREVSGTYRFGNYRLNAL